MPLGEDNSLLVFKRTPSQQDDEEGLGDDFEVQQIRPVFDIIHIELNHSLVMHLTSPAYLPGTGEARHHFEATCIRFGIEGHEAYHCREVEEGAGQPSSSHPEGH